MTQEQMVELMAPAPSTLDSVLTWIRAHSVNHVDVSAHKDLIEVTMPVSEAEAMFGTTIFEFEVGAMQLLLFFFLSPSSCSSSFPLKLFFYDTAQALQDIPPPCHLCIHPPR